MSAATGAPESPHLNRARWVEGRIRELPKLCLCLWNLLLDRHLPPRYQEDVFATLVYVLEGGDMIPPDDGTLRGLDEVTFLLHCFGQLCDRLPAAMFDIHEQILLREGIRIRENIRLTPHMIGSFFNVVRPLFQARVDQRAPLVKNAVKRNELLKVLVGFVSGFNPPPWTTERASRVQAFLVSFQAPR